jgi:NADPH-dependent glutamate synthase beta subunit-like oxidoreductase
LVQDKCIEKDIESIGFEGFDQVRFKGPIRVSRGGPSTSYQCARGAQSNLIWAIRRGQQRKQIIVRQLENNMDGYLFLLFLGLMSCMEGYK